MIDVNKPTPNCSSLHTIGDHVRNKDNDGLFTILKSQFVDEILIHSECKNCDLLITEKRAFVQNDKYVTEPERSIEVRTK